MEQPSTHHSHPKLNQFFATAICGNDIMSSCLYVSGIAVLYSGIFAPLILLSIGFVLFLYKKVYTEVVEALPVNGGAYNCLLNGTSKTIAAVAGVMTFLSYIATAVISAKVGVEYFNIAVKQFAEQFLHTEFELPVIAVTIGLLFLFAMLVISGLKDSAKVALGIFVTHIVTLTLFLALGLIYTLNGGVSHLAANMTETMSLFTKNGGILMTIYLAFSASLLGVSGFESSANFVEEQQKGVFRLTLRNMLLGVVLFNPLIALVVLQCLPYADIIAAKDFLLANAARELGGNWFVYLVAIDALLVLSGAVLTAYVGVSGLLHRMSGDNCIPSYFGKTNSRGSFPRIVISFFLLCSSILLITGGNLLSLAGVYTIAFLGVMSLFALGNLVLRESRTELKRTYKAPIIATMLAFLATAFGMLGNIRIDAQNLTFFEIYFIPALVIVLCVIYQDYIFKFLLRTTKKRFPYLHKYIQMHFSDLTEGRLVAFIHTIERLHQILQYIDRNETGWNITLVHCNEGDNDTHSDAVFKELQETLPTLQKAGFYPHFNIDLLYKNKPFGPQVIREVSEELDVRMNRILIGSIHNYHAFDYEELGGVRIIFG